MHSSPLAVLGRARHQPVLGPALGDAGPLLGYELGTTVGDELGLLRGSARNDTGRCTRRAAGS
jgi:hypothetical protein